MGRGESKTRRLRRTANSPADLDDMPDDLIMELSSRGLAPYVVELRRRIAELEARFFGGTCLHCGVGKYMRGGRCENPDCHHTSPHVPPRQEGEQMVIPADVMQALKAARDRAMRFTLESRIPECGEFGAIAQDLDWACGVLEGEIPSPQQEGEKG